MSDRPNILLVMTDQQTAGAMSCAGNSDLHTPAMDSLAARGIRFDTAYCAQPLCSPSRASMMTGLYPHEVGITFNGPALRDEHRDASLGKLLSGAGYDCAYAGPWHLPDVSIPAGFGFRQLCGHDDHAIADACAAFLAQKRTQPFLLVASIDNPHNICQWARRQPLPWGPIEDAPIERCPELPANFMPAPYEAQALRIEQRRQPLVYPTEAYTHDDWRRYRHAYYRLCEKADQVLQRILDALRHHDHDHDTLVVFTSDHGDGCGAHQWNQKHALFEEPARVPLIVRPPGGMTPRSDATHLVCTGLDLLSTLCDYASVAIPERVRGASLRPLIENPSAADWRDALVIETDFDGDGTLQTQGRMIRDARYKYTVYSWGRCREQLIDLQRDPGEMVNLTESSRYRQVLERLRSGLAQWVRQTGDTFRVPGIQ